MLVWCSQLHDDTKKSTNWTELNVRCYINGTIAGLSTQILARITTTTMIFSFIWASFFPIQTEYCQSVDSLYLLIDIRIEAPLYANFSQSSFWIYQPSYCPVYLCLRWIWFIIRCNVCRFRFSNEIQIKSAESCFAREWNQHCANPQLWLKYRDCLSFNINSEIWIWQNRIDHMHVLSINWNLYAKR